jgi:hypothetical protein
VIVGYSVSGLIGPICRFGFYSGYILVRFILVIICLGLDFAIVLFWVLFWYGLILLFVLLFLAIFRVVLFCVLFWFGFFYSCSWFILVMDCLGLYLAIVLFWVLFWFGFISYYFFL